MHIIWNCRLPSPRVSQTILHLSIYIFLASTSSIIFFILHADHYSNYYCHIKQCVAVDAVVELDLVSALQVSVFPEVIFTKAGKILYREKGNLLINDCVPLHFWICICLISALLVVFFQQFEVLMNFQR